MLEMLLEVIENLRAKYFFSYSKNNLESLSKFAFYVLRDWVYSQL